MVVDAGAGIFVVAVLTTLAVTGAIVFVKGPNACASRRQRRPVSRQRKVWHSSGLESRERTWSAVHDEDPDTPYHSVHSSRPPFKYSEEAQFKVEGQVEDAEASEGESQEHQDPYHFVPLVVEDYTPVQSEPDNGFRRSPVWSKST